jgi:hypothetical protein
LYNDYPSTPIFNCSGSTPAVDPGTATQLGTAVDDPGKSFLDFGFVGLKDFLAVNPAITPTDVTSLVATNYIHDNTVVLTQTSNSPGLNAKVTKTGNSLHFDITNIRIVLNTACGSPIIVKTDIWGSNSNGSDPKAQCYICGLSQSFNDPTISLIKICGSSPFKYDIGLVTSSTTNIHVVYRLYGKDPLNAQPDALLVTSDTIIFKNTTPYDPAPANLPFPYCCIDPWAQWDLYATVAGREFSNIISTPVVSVGCATLPVNLKSFTVVRSNKALVNLKWETAQEDNSKGFDVQRKLPNAGWELIGFV